MSFAWYATLQNFNSQPHEEADTVYVQLLMHVNISTHSLTKRLTRPSPEQVLHGYFNSQPHEEADSIISDYYVIQ